MEKNGFPSGAFAIVSAVNGKALTATGGGPRGRAHKLTMTTLDGSPNQLWTYNGAIVLNKQSGKALDNSGGKNQSPSNNILWPPHGGCNQWLHYCPERKTMIFVGKFRWTLDIEGHGGGTSGKKSAENQWELCGADSIASKLELKTELALQEHLVLQKGEVANQEVVTPQRAENELAKDAVRAQFEAARARLMATFEAEQAAEFETFRAERENTIAAFNEGKQAAHAEHDMQKAAAHTAYAEAVEVAKAARERSLAETQAARQRTIQTARRACDEQNVGLKQLCGDKVGKAKARYGEGMARAKEEHHRGMSAAKASHHTKNVAEQKTTAEHAKRVTEPAQEKEEMTPAVVPGMQVLPLVDFPTGGAFCIVNPTSRLALAPAEVTDPPVKWEGTGAGQWQKMTTAELDGSPTQLWTYDATRRAIIHQATRRALDVSQSAHHHGIGMLILHPLNGSRNQEWAYDAATRALTGKGGALGFNATNDDEAAGGLCINAGTTAQWELYEDCVVQLPAPEAAKSKVAAATAGGLGPAAAGESEPGLSVKAARAAELKAKRKVAVEKHTKRPAEDSEEVCSSAGDGEKAATRALGTMVGLMHFQADAATAALAAHGGDMELAVSSMIGRAFLHWPASDGTVPLLESADSSAPTADAPAPVLRAELDGDASERLARQLQEEQDRELAQRPSIVLPPGIQPCPACNMLIEKIDGTYHVMCGCEAKPAGGTYQKALAGGGCGHEWNWDSGAPLGRGRSGAPANDLQVNF